MIKKPTINPSGRLLTLPTEILELIFHLAFTTEDTYSLSDLLNHPEEFSGLPRHHIQHARLTISRGWYASALRPFLKTTTLHCNIQRGQVHMPGPVSAWMYSRDIERLPSFKRHWITSISCHLPLKDDGWSRWEVHLDAVLRSLPNLRSLELTRVSTTNMEDLRSRGGSCVPCTRPMEKAQWIDAVVAHPKLQRFLASSAVDDDLERRRALKLRTYIQLRLMARNDPRGFERWTNGREGFTQFCRELQSAQDELCPHVMTLGAVAMLMKRVLELRGYEKTAEDYKAWMAALRETSLSSMVSYGQKGVVAVPAVAVEA